MGKFHLYILLTLVIIITVEAKDKLSGSPQADTASAAESDSSDTGHKNTALVEEEEFSLDDLDEEESSSTESASSQAAQGKSGGHGGGHGNKIEAIVAVDGTLDGYLGKKKELSFGTNHEYVLLGFEPHPHISFLIEIIEVVYWEFNYSFSKNSRLKLGKIAIPFGPLFLHQILAGVVEKPVVGGGARHFMVPHVWTEYGIGYYQRFIDSYAVELAGQFWLTNGLQGEVKPADRTVEFTKEPPSWDNNLDKALGVRLTSRWWGKYALNFSFYTCKWADDLLKESGELAEDFYEGDRMVLGNVDVELPYNMIPLPFLKNFKYRWEYALMRTRSTQLEPSGKDLRVPWHNKNADLIEVTFNGLHKWFDLRFRYGTYDDNWDVTNSRDLVNYNLAAVFKIAPGIEFIPMYMWNRERVNEVKDDAILVKCFIRL